MTAYLGFFCASEWVYTAIYNYLLHGFSCMKNKHRHKITISVNSVPGEIVVKNKALIYLLVIFLLFLFPQTIKAAEYGNVHFYKITEDGNLEWADSEVEIPDGLTVNERAALIFTRLFEDAEIPFIPDNVEILGVSVFDGCLGLNVSGDILNYGGTYYEIHLRNQIIKTALSIPGISKVSLSIENLREHLTEGGIIKETTGWNESSDTVVTANENG